MKEKIRVLTEGRRIVLIIEDTTEGDLLLLQKVIGDIAFKSLETINPNEPNEVDVPKAPDLPKIEPSEKFEDIPDNADVIEEETELETEIQSPSEEYTPVIMSKGRFKGKTLKDIMEADCSYVKWMVEKNHNEFKWEDFDCFKAVWSEKAKAADTKDLILMVRTLDLRNETVSIENEIVSGLGISKLEELSNELDIEMVREILEGHLNG